MLGPTNEHVIEDFFLLLSASLEFTPGFDCFLLRTFILRTRAVRLGTLAYVYIQSTIGRVRTKTKDDTHLQTLDGCSGPFKDNSIQMHVCVNACIFTQNNNTIFYGCI